MRISTSLRAGLVALTALAGASAVSTTAAYADSGTIRISVVKGGWFIGASGGSGTLTFHGRRYPLSIGGLSAGLVFGASQTYLSGRVSHISRPSDVPPAPQNRSAANISRRFFMPRTPDRSPAAHPLRGTNAIDSLCPRAGERRIPQTLHCASLLRLQSAR